MSFLWPWLLIFIPLPLFVLRNKDSGTDDSAIEVPSLLAEALPEAKHRNSSLTLTTVLWWLAWTSILLAAAQPQLDSGKEIKSASGRELMLVMDLSGSMERQDFSLDGIPQDRLSVVKQVAGQFIEQRKGDRIGLVLFGDEAFVASPLSFDLTAAVHALAESEIGMAGRTTALGNALGLALVKLHETPSKEKAVILLTDGSNNAGNADPLSAAELAAEWNIRVHTIGLGSQKPKDLSVSQDPSAELDTTTLKAIASKSGGRFFRADTTQSLEAIYTSLDQLEASDQAAPPLRTQQDIRHYFLLVALAALLILIGRFIRQLRTAS